jgi:peptide/nickel transport system substrate-binding protein
MRTRPLAAVLLALALLAAACQGRRSGGDGGGGQAARGVKGGTLRVLDLNDVEAFDPGIAYGAADLALLRGVVRELYAFDSRARGERAAVPVPDLADGPSRLSADGRTYTFRIRRGVRYAPPVNREVRAGDFVYAIERQLGRGRPSPSPYAQLIQGAAAFAAGRAATISGLRAAGDHTLTITLRQPASDFLGILTLPSFSPVPREYASRFRPGQDYGRHLVGSGPYTLRRWVPGVAVTLERNRNWQPRTDPLRAAWVDGISVSAGASPAAIQQALERGDADLNLDGVPPRGGDLLRLSADPALSRRFAVETTGCVVDLDLRADAGPTRDLRVREAVNHAVDKQVVLLALGGRFAGDPASTILSPTLAGYSGYDLYPSAESRGDPERAKALLARAGYPHGVTLNYVGQSNGQGPALFAALQSSLTRAGIHLNPTTYPGYQIYTRSLQVRAKKDEHQVGAARWCPDFPGNGSRSFVGVLLDGRKITATANNNYGDYDNPKVNAMIDQAYATQDAAARNRRWAEIDRQLMQDAAWAPLVYDREAFFWSSRVRHWTFTPWLSNPDVANLWLDPNSP